MNQQAKQLKAQIESVERSISNLKKQAGKTDPVVYLNMMDSFLAELGGLNRAYSMVKDLK